MKLTKEFMTDHRNIVETHFNDLKATLEAKGDKKAYVLNIEYFNGSFRDECLNVSWFLSFDDAYVKIEARRNDYNEFRPHSSLDNLTPAEFAGRQIQEAA